MTKKQVGRIAMRVEGDWWVAYFAQPDTMVGALEFARIKMALVQDRQRRDTFQSLMRDCIGDILVQRVGRDPEFITKPADLPPDGTNRRQR